MRINRLVVENFKKYRTFSVDLDPSFTLLIGENGSGKTTVLDALAIAIGVWGKKVPKCSRNIKNEEVSLKSDQLGDRVLFTPELPTSISAEGSIGNTQGLRWTRRIKKDGSRTSNAHASGVEDVIENLLKESEENKSFLPVLAYYGAGRAWLPSNKKPGQKITKSKPQKFDAYRKCLDTRIHDQELNEWFLFETAAISSLGKSRPGFEVVKRAVINCVPQAKDLHYDIDLKEIVLSINGEPQPFYNLSAGQRMMVALIADIAIKAVTLNSFFLEQNDNEFFLNSIPGIVLIDELDVHIHPSWQRRIAADLKIIFPNLQFVCTSHSPQIIGELLPNEIRILEQSNAHIPPYSIGLDSNRVLEEIMGAKPRNEEIQKTLDELFQLIDSNKFSEAETLISKLQNKIVESDPELTRAKTLISFLRDRPE